MFLDRDGVLNATEALGGTPRPPHALEDLRLLPGVEAACVRLRNAGLALVCVTNQPDIARGTANLGLVTAMNARLKEQLRLDAVLMCPHDDSDDCECRKPRPGMLLKAARTLSIDLGASVMVGDRWRDVEAGRRAGCRTVFVDHRYPEQRPLNPDLVVAGLPDAVPWVIDQLVGGASYEENLA